jgi:NADPH:quinone reductase-like Zn-dependent oxidoreductase
MKAVLATKYGPVDSIEVKEVDKPIPNEDQVLVKVVAASLNTADMAFNGGLLPRLLGGFSKPSDPRLGSDLAGRVESVGNKVTEFKPGDEVFGTGRGSFAEYAVAREVRLAQKPANITFEQAAAVPVAGITAIQGLRDFGHIQPGQKVLIYGASGAVGTFAVQIAKTFGAEITAVTSTKNLEQALSMGADQVIDYTKTDFTCQEQKYDLIVGVNGYHPILKYRRVLNPQGMFILVGADHRYVFRAIGQAMLIGPLVSRKGGQKLGWMGIAKINLDDLVALQSLLEKGKIVSVIDRRYALNETAEAMKYLLTGHSRAKIIINVEGGNN